MHFGCADTDKGASGDAVGQKRHRAGEPGIGEIKSNEIGIKAEGAQGPASQKAQKRKRGSLDSFFIKNAA